MKLFIAPLFALTSSSAFVQHTRYTRVAHLGTATLETAPTESATTTENERFQLDPSVNYWLNFSSKGQQENINTMANIVQKQLSKSNTARNYMVSHLLRTGYFTVNAALGSIASDIHERFIARNTGEAQEADTVAVNQQGIIQGLISTDLPSRLLLEAIESYAQEIQWVEKDVLKFPWDATIQDSGRVQLDHKQVNPLFVFSETANFISEAVGTISRRNKGVPSKGPISADVFPEYYRNDFHYQTDGWLSTKSAERYEASTETLFLGRQDAMQRQTLIPLLKDGRKPESVLEVACGTGRFATFLRDNLPEADVTLTDLSPFYLQKARENDEYWRSYTKKSDKPATLLQANAEELPFADNSFDSVVNVYLFHELPPEARQRAASEMVRVCKPGGMIVVTDSQQEADRPDLGTMRDFSRLNEPHYITYLETNLADLFEGCECHEKHMSSVSKTLSFIKKET